MLASQIVTGLLVFARVGGLLLAFPVLSTRGIPRLYLFFLTFALTIVITPIIPGGPIPPTLGLLIGDVVVELLLGILMGSCVKALFSAMSMGVELASTQMGFGLGGMLDPMTNTSGGGPLGTLFSWMATLLFLS